MQNSPLHASVSSTASLPRPSGPRPLGARVAPRSFATSASVSRLNSMDSRASLRSMVTASNDENSPAHTENSPVALKKKQFEAPPIVTSPTRSPRKLPVVAQSAYTTTTAVSPRPPSLYSRSSMASMRSLQQPLPQPPVDEQVIDLTEDDEQVPEQHPDKSQKNEEEEDDDGISIVRTESVLRHPVHSAPVRRDMSTSSISTTPVKTPHRGGSPVRRNMSTSSVSSSPVKTRGGSPVLRDMSSSSISTSPVKTAGARTFSSNSLVNRRIRDFSQASSYASSVSSSRSASTSTSMSSARTVSSSLTASSTLPSPLLDTHKFSDLPATSPNRPVDDNNSNSPIGDVNIQSMHSEFLKSISVTEPLHIQRSAATSKHVFETAATSDTAPHSIPSIDAPEDEREPGDTGQIPPQMQARAPAGSPDKDRAHREFIGDVQIPGSLLPTNLFAFPHTTAPIDDEDDDSLKVSNLSSLNLAAVLENEKVYPVLLGYLLLVYITA